MKQGVGKSDRRWGRYFAISAVATALLSPVFLSSVAAKLSAPIVGESWMDRFTPAGVDSRLAEKIKRDRNAAALASATNFPFTPAGASERRDEIITVAARATGRSTADAVSVRSAIAGIEAGRGSTVRLNNSDYQLTASRGWQGFTTPIAQAVTIEQPRLDQLVGNGDFRLDGAPKKKPSRFNTEMSVAKVGNVANPRGNAAAGDYAMKVGGSFSISRRVDVTAGVRYASERDRVNPAADNRADSEAVYVGTKIRF